MRYIEVFEKFDLQKSKPAGVLKALGDWSDISKSWAGGNFLNPSTLLVTYYKNPSQKMISEVWPGASKRYANPDEVVEEVFGGDQNQSNISREFDGLYIITDGNFSPEDYKSKLQDYIGEFNNDPAPFEADLCGKILREPNHKNLYTPEFLAHCDAVVANDQVSPSYFYQNPGKFGKISGAEGKIMKPRIKLIFDVKFSNPISKFIDDALY